MNFNNIYIKFNETIYGNIATVYHRTDSFDLIKDMIAGKKFIPGDGKTYGKGMYSTFDFKNAITDNGPSTKKYGMYIIKFKISNLSNYLICDDLLFKKLSKSKDLLNKNFILSCITKLLESKALRPVYKGVLEKIKNIVENNSNTTEELNSLSYKYIKLHAPSFIAVIVQLFDFGFSALKICEAINTLKGEMISSNMAYAISSSLSLDKYISGLVFINGYHDGDVLVTYKHDVKSLIPLAYSKDEGNTWINILPDKTVLHKILNSKISHTQIINNKPICFSLKNEYDGVSATLKETDLPIKEVLNIVPKTINKLIVPNAKQQTYDLSSFKLKSLEIKGTLDSCSTLINVNSSLEELTVENTAVDMISNNLPNLKKLWILKNNIKEDMTYLFSNLTELNLIQYEGDVLNLPKTIDNIHFRQCILHRVELSQEAKNIFFSSNKNINSQFFGFPKKIGKFNILSAMISNFGMVKEINNLSITDSIIECPFSSMNVELLFLSNTSLNFDDLDQTLPISKKISIIDCRQSGKYQLAIKNEDSESLNPIIEQKIIAYMKNNPLCEEFKIGEINRNYIFYIRNGPNLEKFYSLYSTFAQNFVAKVGIV